MLQAGQFEHGSCKQGSESIFKAEPELDVDEVDFVTATGCIGLGALGEVLVFIDVKALTLAWTSDITVEFDCFVSYKINKNT